LPVTLINPFVVSDPAVAGFVESWKKTAAVFAGKPGYLDTRLHRAITPHARFRFVNVAHWTDAAAWAEAMKAFPPAEGGTPGIEANPALYEPVPGGAVPARNPAAEDAIRDAEHALAQAYQANDAAALEHLLDDDYAVTDGPGTVSDKAKVLEDHETKRLQVRSFRFDDMQVRLLGPEAAVVTGQYTWDASYAGQPIPGATFRYLRVYARTDAGWRVKAGQVTPVLGPRG
jgi:uncharacterized protein (TIGR02246 family)